MTGPVLSSILLVTNEYPPEKTAGTAMSTQFLAEELVSRGHRVTVVVNTRRTAPPREVADGLEVLRLRPLPVPMTRMVQRAGQLVSVARRTRPDLIQGQSISAGALAVLAGRALRIPAAVYIQGLDLYESGHWARRTYIRWALRRGDLVAAVTADLQQKAFEISGRQAEVVPHGVRMRAVHSLDRAAARLHLGLPPAVPVVLFVGRLIAIKGVDHLLRALPRIRDVHADALLVVVGDGAERERLGALARDLGMESAVVFAGPRPHEDVIRYMRAADLFVLPSLVESFGIVLLEAMSCGLPVVASRVMGIPSVVNDGIHGLLIPPADPQAIAGAVLSLMADPQRRAAMSAGNAREASRYTVPRIADRFVGLWERTVDAYRTGSGPGPAK